MLASRTEAYPTRMCSVCGESLPFCGRMLSCNICEEDICFDCYTTGAGRERQAMRRRLVALLQAQHRAYTRHVNGRHLHVTVLGVEPLQQRRGVASTLLRATNAIADARRIPIYLETQGWRNVNMYERYGFDVVQQATVIVSHPDGNETLSELFGLLRTPIEARSGRRGAPTRAQPQSTRQQKFVPWRACGSLACWTVIGKGTAPAQTSPRTFLDAVDKPCSAHC